ncbi:MAG: 3-deoxy-D-manno-octulosonic acid transferase [Muribaculaceae bacterium]|nr:3-deoxy-D-manno-octulosonic acid transferase [Muribaculaceae bacterium]
MSSPLYDIAIHAYAGAVRLAAVRSAKADAMLRGQADCIRNLRKIRAEKAPDGFAYWFHAASLGEFEQARPLIEAIKAGHPATTVLLSFFSPSGYNVRHNWPGADAVVYLPFDTPRRVKAFLDAAAPRKAIFVKYEFWANYLHELNRREIPVYIISAIFRPKQRFFRPWGAFWRNVLHCFTHIFVQDDDSKQLLDNIGAGEKTTVAGDTRFDRVAQLRNEARQLPEIEAFTTAARFTIVFGSSWPADEQHYIPWLHDHPDVKAIIAPHEFDNARLDALCRALGPDNTILLSELRQNPDKAGTVRYLIIDCFGLLGSIYRYGQAALVGGGFGTGIHNINEAAVYGIPVLFGPNNHKFREAAGLQSCGGGFCYHDRDTLAAILDRFVSDPAALTAAGEAAVGYIKANTGATAAILRQLDTV